MQPEKIDSTTAVKVEVLDKQGIVAADRAFRRRSLGVTLGGIPPFASHDERQERQKTRRKL
jgi:hypothetical protein